MTEEGYEHIAAVICGKNGKPRFATLFHSYASGDAEVSRAHCGVELDSSRVVSMLVSEADKLARVPWLCRRCNEPWIRMMTEHGLVTTSAS